ncbi:endo-1,4-beta-xylanase [Flavobacterium agrisoli]|uniref:endo-1,4-beta-xylanase n=1 Tax=Flavobacterium agrisoli TaxID=2793066 RepID=A0A934PJN5_9FLAO|nr:endo-1,4-beta-xylanase [Flavobacterium agrisoli]MBK0369371.1 endo-1,4-beta-xylanase [Flavobacterium agrisoli]
MKFKNILPVIASSLVLFSACDEQKMEWGKDPSHGEVASSELPLALAEKITRYEPLKTYATSPLGVGIGVDLYLSDPVYRAIVNENFDEVVPGYAMKHAAMVKSNGTIDYTKMDEFISQTKAAGLSVFGHTLIWHQNQNASYLNGLIAPTIIPGASGANSLNIAGLKDGTFSGGWARNNPGAGISVVDGAGLTATSKALKLISSATSSQNYNLQLTSPNVSIVTGHNYEISFFIKSEQDGKGRLSFTGLVNNYPWKDWFANGASWTEAFVTSSQWKQVKIKLAPADFVTSGTSFKFNLDLGYLPNVTYYIDVNTLNVVDLDAPATVANLVSNGDFEGNTLNPWSGYGNSSTRAVSANGQGYNNKGYAMVLTNPTAANNYSAQQVYTFASALTKDKEYTCTFWAKASVPISLQLELQNAAYSGDYYSGITIGTSWTQVTRTLKPSTADRTKFVFDFGETAATLWIDDVVITEAGATSGPSGPVTVEKTEAQKTQIIEAAMTDWISKMITHYKNDVKAWDVVNEPMKEGGSLRDGVVTEMASDEFYWVKYLGKEYAVKAFKLARQYGNASDKLFINDYNLESSLAKCDGLIDYVKYIESQGATVDGIGTQMHISLTTNKDQIVQMFQKLAATGKFIKVSELDIRLGTKTPTAVQMADQSAMYQFVIDSYNQYIPKAQQYGITIWGVSDSEKEHENWLPDESPNLWDASYQRKHAYKGVSDGLAGKDVSKDFSGDLIIGD